MSDWQTSGSTADGRGQSETIGVALMLVVTVLATGLVVGLGGTALDDAQGATETRSAEHAMTLFDSRAAQVALGDSDVQTVSLGRLEGDYEVQPDAGSITVTHVDWDGSDDEVIYQADLGAVVYRNGDRTLVYQGGGVWRRGPGGGSAMVSPPEFHYREATLTLPVVRVRGDGGAGGAASATIESAAAVQRVFPEAATHYGGDPSDPAYLNPAEDGQVQVTVQSDYYRAWAEYFRGRTSGTVAVDDAAEEVTVELVSAGSTGHFAMPGEGSGVEVRGISGHSVEEFSITLRPDDSDSANFANLKWSMYVEDGPTRFEMHLRSNGGSGCSTVASATVYYSNDSGSTYQGWYDDDAFAAECGDYDGDGDDEVRMVVDFIDDDDGDGDADDAEAGDPSLEYVSLSNPQTVHFNPTGSVADPATLDGHGASWEPSSYEANDGDEATLDRLVNHYFSEMGEFDLTVDDKNSDTVSEDVSSGTIDYSGGGRYISYLHVTENRIVVEFD